MVITMHKGSPQEQDGKVSKNETLTFRIDHDNVKKLRTEAESQGISLNSLINQILKSFMEWHIFEPKIGMVPLSKPVVEELFTKMSKEQIIDIAMRVGRNEMQNAAMFMKGGKIDLDSFLSYFENRLKNSSIQMNHTFDNSSRTHVYIIKHDICENWSLYFKEMLLYIFNEVLGKTVDINTSYNMLTFKFKQED
jgi:HicB-like protein involved in pilus formation